MLAKDEIIRQQAERIKELEEQWNTFYPSLTEKTV